MSTRISFDQLVRVKLTPHGVQQFESFFGDLSDGQQVPRASLPTLPTPDADGAYAIELWMLVSVFGGSSIRGKQHTAALFEGNVMIV